MYRNVLWPGEHNANVELYIPQEEQSSLAISGEERKPVDLYIALSVCKTLPH